MISHPFLRLGNEKEVLGLRSLGGLSGVELVSHTQ